MTLLLTKNRSFLRPIKLQASIADVEDWTRCIQSLNDAFRLCFTSTELYCSPGILKFGIEDQETILNRVRSYRTFNEKNDPQYLHNRGTFDYDGETVAWEIYCSDKDCRSESPNPANLDLTQRHMMILLEEEWWTDLPNQTA